MDVRTFKSGRTHSGYVFYEIDSSSLEKVKETANHFICKCPWCDAEKLYFSFRRGVGFCFHCEVVVTNRGQEPTKVILDTFSWLAFLHLESFKDISWTDTALISHDAKIYLSKRKYDYDDETIQKFNFRYFTGVSDEVILLLPNSYPERLKVDSFQTTIIKGKNYGPKYLTYSDNKVLYFLNRINDPSIMIFVEGIFDAVSVSVGISDRVKACSLLGKSFSKSQERQLYNYLKLRKPKEVIVALDGEVTRHRKLQTCRQILSIDSSLKVYYVDLPDNLDPEEAVADGVFHKSLNNAKRVLA